MRSASLSAGASMSWGNNVSGWGRQMAPIRVLCEAAWMSSGW